MWHVHVVYCQIHNKFASVHRLSGCKLLAVLSARWIYAFISGSRGTAAAGSTASGPNLLFKML